jgi:hypothetical protein
LTGITTVFSGETILMAIQTTTPVSIQGEHRIVIRAVGWQGYQSLLKMVGDQPVRLTYDRGDVELMSPLPIHERKKSCLGRAVRILTEELLMPVMPMGSTTRGREDLVPMAGIERFATMEGFRDEMSGLASSVNGSETISCLAMGPGGMLEFSALEGA